MTPGTITNTEDAGVTEESVSKSVPITRMLRFKARGCLCVDALSTASKPSSPDRGQAQMMRSVNQPSATKTIRNVTHAAALVESSLRYFLATQELTAAVAAAARTTVAAIIRRTPRM